MRKRMVKLVDDGSRYTVYQTLRQADGKYSDRAIIDEHLNVAEAMNLIQTLKGVSEYCKEDT